MTKNYASKCLSFSNMTQVNPPTPTIGQSFGMPQGDLQLTHLTLSALVRSAPVSHTMLAVSLLGVREPGVRPERVLASEQGSRTEWPPPGRETTYTVISG